MKSYRQISRNMNLKFTRGELTHLLFLVLDNEKEGSYYLSQSNWNKQTESLKKKIQMLLEE
jgi:hypothetical protein